VQRGDALAPLPVGETGGSKGQGEGRGGGSPGLHKPKARKAGDTPPLGLKAAPLPARGAKPLRKWAGTRWRVPAPNKTRRGQRRRPEGEAPALFSLPPAPRLEREAAEVTRNERWWIT